MTDIKEKESLSPKLPNRVLSSGRSAVIAGGGNLPVAILHALYRRGENPLLIVVQGEADKCLYKFKHCEISIMELTRLIQTLKTSGVEKLILAGAICHRPKLRELYYDSITLRALPKFISALTKGDDALLRTFIAFIEEYGFRVVGAHEIVPELLAPFNTILTHIHPDTEQRNDIDHAVNAARQLGMQDIGQAVVIIKGQIIAKEDIKGTDAMLEHLYETRLRCPLSSSGGILVKTAKPNQEMRVDLPTIGPETVENSRKAKLQGIAVEAGSSFILDRARTIQLADEYGMFIACL